MAPPHTILEAFAQASALVDQLSDPKARECLEEWQRQCAAVPTYHPRQDYLLSKVKMLTAQLQQRSLENS